MYPPTLLSKYTTYINILKINEISIFSFSIATIYTFLVWAPVAPMHLLYHDWMVLQCMSYSYTFWILNLCTESSKWPINMKLVSSTSICNAAQQHNICHTVIIATITCWVLRKWSRLLNHYRVNIFIGHVGVTINMSVQS